MLGPEPMSIRSFPFSPPVSEQTRLSRQRQSTALRAFPKAPLSFPLGEAVESGPFGTVHSGIREVACPHSLRHCRTQSRRSACGSA